MKKFFCYLLIIGTLFSSIISFGSVDIKADTTGLGAVFGALKICGLSDVAAAAIVGNAAGESGGNPSASQPGGAGIGIFQWSNDGNRQDLANYCAGSAHSGHDKVTLKGYTICNRVDCQCAFMIMDLDSRLNSTKWSSYYNQEVKSNSTLASGASSGKIPSSVSISNSGSGFKSQSKLEDATIQFYLDYETAGATKCFWVGNSGYDASKASSFITGYGTRYGAAKNAYDKYSGSTYESPKDGSSGDSEVAKGIAEQLYNCGYWTEDQLSAYCKLTEINIQDLYLDGATREALTQDELSGLANWQLNVRMQEEEHGFIRFLRTLSMFIGIILVVWAMLFYTAYWIDKTNNILPIEFVFLLSFGKLRISGDENDSTYSFNSESSAKVKMINHKDCIFICVIAVGAGFLLITGIFYSIVQGFVNKALQLLGRV